MNNQTSLGRHFFGMDSSQWLFSVNSELTVLDRFPEIWQQAVAKLVSASVCSKGLVHE
jgi:hypothetical protein